MNPMGVSTVIVEGSVSTPLTYALSNAMGLNVQRAGIHPFPSGEWSIDLNACHVKGRHVIVLHGMHAPGIMQPMSGDDNRFLSLNEAWIASCFIVRKVKQGGAHAVTMVCPFLPYGRQNHEHDRSFQRMVVDWMHGAGVDHIITLDMHNDALIDPCLLVQSVRSTDVWAHHIGYLPDAVVVATDKGGQGPASALARAVQSTHDPVFLSKKRTNDGLSIIPPEPASIQGKHCIIVDDILDTGSTIRSAVHALQGCASVTLCITHGLWSGTCIDHLNSVPIHRMLVLDSVTCTQPLPPYATVVPCAELLANTLGTIKMQSSMVS